MISNKDTAIQAVQTRFESFSDLVLAQLDLLLIILKSDDEDRITDDISEVLHKNEENIDAGEMVLDNLIVQTIVLHQPMASDLRQLFALYRMVINLERIGDLVIKISNIIRDIQEKKMIKNASNSLFRMLSLASQMVNKSLVSFINNDRELAIWTIKQDEVIDKMNRKLLKKIIKKGDLINNEDSMMLLADIRSIISSIERIGDHATNIAEASVYSLLGSNIKHQSFSKSNDF